MDGAPPYFDRNGIHFNVINGTEPVAWSSRSPDPNPLDFTFATFERKGLRYFTVDKACFSIKYSASL